MVSVAGSVRSPRISEWIRVAFPRLESAYQLWGTGVGDFKFALLSDAPVHTLAAVDEAPPPPALGEDWHGDDTGALIGVRASAAHLPTLRACWEMTSLTRKVAGRRSALVLCERGIPIPVHEFPSPGSLTGNERAPDQF